jgi:hypothetical protein
MLGVPRFLSSYAEPDRCSNKIESLAAQKKTLLSLRLIRTVAATH